MGRVLVGAERSNTRLLTFVDGVLKQRGVRRSPDKAPHVPVAGTLTVSMFREKSHEDFLVSGDIIALRAMVVASKYFYLAPVRSKTPQEVRGAVYTA